MYLFQAFCLLLTYFAVGHAFREAKIQEFPFQVSIKTFDNKHLCGGAILTSKWIISASNCVKNLREVVVGYGSADSSHPLNAVRSNNIIHQSPSMIPKEGLLVLINLNSEIEFSQEAKPAKLPTRNAKLRNSTKLSGWNTNSLDQHLKLYASDGYNIIIENCLTKLGEIVPLKEDEFCGDDEVGEKPASLGSLVTKDGIVLGLLQTEVSSLEMKPNVFVKLSEHEQWIKDTLGSDAQHVTWVDKVPKNSSAQKVVGLLVLGISSVFLHLFN